MALPMLAQTDSVVVADVVAVESKENVDFRVPLEDKIEKYREDARFKYYRERSNNPGLLDRIIRWLWDLLPDMSGPVTTVFGAFKYVVLGIIVLLIVLLVLKLAGVNYKVLLGKKKVDTAEIDIYTENVNEMDFETLIRNALQSKNYRLATRFLYLKNLKLLSDKEIIKWDITKTNISYIYEINDQSLRSKFLDTSLIFDYVWYGEFDIDSIQYAEIDNRMNDFAKSITNER
jgi:hypothetical protein